MVMWFNNPQARIQLLTKGHVFTLRPKIRRTGYEPLFYDNFEKKGTVLVTYLMEVNIDWWLEPYCNESGFLTIASWRAAAGDSRFLYRVDLTSLVSKKED